MAVESVVCSTHSLLRVSLYAHGMPNNGDHGGICRNTRVFPGRRGARSVEHEGPASAGQMWCSWW